MTAVWYIGSGNQRIIDDLEWLQANVVGDDVIWNKANGWSVPKAEFTEAQLLILDLDGGFWTSAPDGPRVWRLVPGIPSGGGGQPPAGANPVNEMLAILAQAREVRDSIQDVAADALQVAQDRIFVTNAKSEIEALMPGFDAALAAAQAAAADAALDAQATEDDRAYITDTLGQISLMQGEIQDMYDAVQATFLNITNDILPVIAQSVDDVEADRLAAQASAAAAAISEANAAATGGVTSVGGFQGAVTKTQLGINNVDNTPDIEKPISNPVQSAFDFLSAAFGDIISEVQTEVATKQDAPQVNSIVSAAISNLVGAAPGSLDTIYELAAALQGNSATIGDLATAIGLRAMANAVVNLTGNQDVSGTKNFTTGLQQGGKAVVVTDDARMTNARTPTSHSHVMGDVTGLASELSTINGALLMKVNSVTGQTITFWAGNQASYDALSSGTKTAAGFIAAIF